ncbi:MAG: hypothetical protein AAB535_03305 [Patescibacteria group bacterium]
MGFIQHVKTLPVSAKRLLGVGIIFAFVIALPLFIWSVINLRFDVRERARVGPTCQPRPACLDQLPHPCQIVEPEDGWCQSTTARATATATVTATVVATSTSTSTPTTLPIGGPNGEPNSCGGTCGSKYNCGANLYCYQGFCRNPICPSDSNCICATPTPTPTPTPKKSASPKPSPTMEIVYISPLPSPSSSPTFKPTASPTPIAIESKSPNLNFLLYIAGGSFFLALVLLGFNSIRKI